jgi:hypothetical protein
MRTAVGILAITFPYRCQAAHTPPWLLSRPNSPVSDPMEVVESFLAARDARGSWGAASWCADLLELQDVDGSWFVDTAAPATGCAK